jgi:hypothetical protein
VNQRLILVALFATVFAVHLASPVMTRARDRT